jgi:threonine aldolase
LSAEAELLAEPDVWDRYGDKGPVAALEADVARLLDKPAAVMFPSGIMAQQAMLRVWCDRMGSRRVALPGLSHLLHHEMDGPQLLHGLQYERLTTGPVVPTVVDLHAITGPLGAVLLELPLRDAGYLLPRWEDLVSLSAACRDRGVPLHFDGARICESAPGLGHPLSGVAALADSVYVSFYKGLGALSGAALAGPEDAVSEARRWRQRQGGTLFTMYPTALSALRGLRDRLPQMPALHVLAGRLASELTARGVTVFPEPPHTNAFRLFAPAPAETVMDRMLAMMAADKVALTPPWRPAEVPGWSFTEFTVGAATAGWDLDEAADLLARVALGTDRDASRLAQAAVHAASTSQHDGATR